MPDFWTPDNLQRLTQGRWLSPADPASVATGLWHDTRGLRPGEVYLALRGERVDGHHLLPQAADAGAALAIVTDPEARHDTLPLLLVEDAIAALHALASAWRAVLAEAGCTVISVSGSNGKTTTRHLIHHVLTSAGLAGTQAPASFNNHLGVPLTLLRAKPDHRFVAVELGTNHPGEIDALARLATPDIAVIPSLGEEHLEAFGDLDGVVREEAAILPHVRPGGTVLTACDAGVLLAEHYSVQEGVGMTTVRAGDTWVPEDLPLPGMHNRDNAALAAAVARLLGASEAGVLRSLRAADPPANRSRVRRIGSVTLIDDCYNANPASMRAALAVLSEMPGRRVAILGEMRELGAASALHHAEIAALARSAVDRVILLGDGFDAPLSDPTETVDQLRPGDAVLLKASRGMRLERLIPAIEARFADSADDAVNPH